MSNSIKQLCTEFNLQDSQNNNTNDNYNYYENGNGKVFNDKMCTEMKQNCDEYLRVHGARQEVKHAKCMAHYNIVCEKKY